jgi:hypothetical protein
MSSDSAELSSVASTLDDLTARVDAIAGRFTGTKQEDVALGLHDVERLLRSASRRLESVRRDLR